MAERQGFGLSTIIAWTLICLLLGTAFGQWWRMKQIEPLFNGELGKVKKEVGELSGVTAEIEARLDHIEKEIKNGR
jgi:hypothetical protein